METGTISGVNWTVIGGILAVIIPICLTFIGVWLKNFSKPNEIKGIREDLDKSNLEINTKIDKLTDEVEGLLKDFDKKLNGLRMSLENKHSEDHEEIVEKITKAKEDLSSLNAEIMVLQTNQNNNDKTLTEIKEDYKNLAKRLETIVDKMIEFMSTTD